MNLQDLLVDRQLSLNDIRRLQRLDEQKRKHPTQSARQRSLPPPFAIRPAPEPPLPSNTSDPTGQHSAAILPPQQSGQRTDAIGERRRQYPKHPFPRPEPEAEGNPNGLAVPGTQNAALLRAMQSGYGVGVGPDGKPLVGPQVGSKEDLRRRKAYYDELQRIELARQAIQLQAHANHQAEHTSPSPSSWYTAESSSTMVTNGPHPGASNGSGSDSGSVSASMSRSASSGPLQRSTSSVSRRRVHAPPGLIVTPPHMEGSGSNLAPRRQSSIGSSSGGGPYGSQVALVVVEEEDHESSRSPEAERKLCASPAYMGSPNSAGSEGDLKASIITHSPTGSASLQRAQLGVRARGASLTLQQASLYGEAGQPETTECIVGSGEFVETRPRTSQDTVGSHGGLTMTGTDTEDTLKTPTTVDFSTSSKDKAVKPADIPIIYEAGEADSQSPVPTIISGTPDEALTSGGDSNMSQNGYFRGLPSQILKGCRSISEAFLDRKLSTLSLSSLGRRDESVASAFSSRRASMASSHTNSDESIMGSNGLPRGAFGQALHRDFWKLDDHVFECEGDGCDAQFTVRLRKHHCRSCGGIFCAPHSSHRIPLYYPSITADDDEVADYSQTTGTSPIGGSTPIPGRIAPGRVCEPCYIKLAHPEQILREAMANTNVKQRICMDVKGIDALANLLDEHEADEAWTGQPVYNPKSARRMFSAPPSPPLASPPEHSPLGNGDFRGPDSPVVRRSSSNVSSIRRQASSRGHSRVQSRSGSTLHRQASTGHSTARNKEQAIRRGLSPGWSSPGEVLHQSGYFGDASPTSAKSPHTPEPEPPLSAIMATYPLAHKSPRVTSPTRPYSPHHPTSPDMLSLGSIAGPGRPLNPRSTSLSNRHHLRLNMPANDFVSSRGLMSPGRDQSASTSRAPSAYTTAASSAGIMTPDKEFIPSKWGYDQATFDPELSDTDGEEDAGHETRGRSKLVVDGPIRLKAHPLIQTRSEPYHPSHLHFPTCS